MTDIKGKRIAIIGLGRSGLAVAKAVISKGGEAVAFDQNSEDALSKKDIPAQLRNMNVRIQFQWDGKLDKTDWDYAVINPAIPYHSQLIQGLQESGVKLWSEIEFAYQIAKAPIVAVTGTNGKSTTVAMTYYVLKYCGESPIVCGNIYGTGLDEVTLTEAALKASESDVLVAEVSSAQLEFIENFKPVSCGITNITQDHSDRYLTFEEYSNIKLRLFENLGSDDYVIAKDDQLIQSMLIKKGPQILKYGEKNSDASEEALSLRILDKTVLKSELHFGGSYNYENAQMACLLAYGYLQWRASRDRGSHASKMLMRAAVEQLPVQKNAEKLPEELLIGLRKFAGIKYRMNVIGKKADVTFIDNSMCTNPQALIHSLGSLQGKAHVLIGGVTKGADFHPLKLFLDRNPLAIYLYGRDRYLLQSMLDSGDRVYETMEEAFAGALNNVQANEVLILSPGCASQDQFRDFQHRGDVFRALVLVWMKLESVNDQEVENGKE